MHSSTEEKWANDSKHIKGKEKKVTARIKALIKKYAPENNVRVVAGFFLFFEWLWPNNK